MLLLIIHSFIQAISIAPLQDTPRILHRSFTPKHHKQLQVKD